MSNLKIEISDTIVAELLRYVRDHVPSAGERCEKLKKAANLATMFWPALSSLEKSDLKVVSGDQTNFSDSVLFEKTAP